MSSSRIQVAEAPSQSGAALKVVVTDKQVIAEDVVTVELARPDGRRLPDWTSGAHLDLVLPGGMTRQYSLCGDRLDPFHYRIGVLREPDGRGGSAFVHDELTVGMSVEIGGPRNNFRLAPSREFVFMAGGIGITPILPMLRDAETLGVRWRLLYGGRTRRSMAFLDELARYGERVTVVPEDEQGRLDLERWLPEPDVTTKVYCCGPAGLLEAVEQRAAELGLHPGQLRTERFVPKRLGAPARALPFEVELRRSGTTVTVTNDRSVLQTVREAGANVLSSCSEGMCGTCETVVLDGEPDHRDSLLGEADHVANRTMLICVSRSLSDRLALDL